MLRCVCRESGDKLLELFDLLLSLLVLLLDLTLSDLGVLEPEVLVTDNCGDLTKVNVNDVCTDLV